MTVMDYDRSTSLPDFFATVTDDVDKVRIIVDGEVFAAFDTRAETDRYGEVGCWWRQEMAEANGRAFLDGLVADDEGG